MNSSTGEIDSTVSAVDKSILRRIKKMLDRAEHANANPNEAAIAAKQAASLMAKYRLDRAIVEAEGGVQQSEPIDVEIVFELPTTSIPSWFCALARAVADVNNCKYFFDRGKASGKRKAFRIIRAVGRTTDRQAVKILLEFVTREIDRLAALALSDRSCECGAKAVDARGRCQNCGASREAPKVFGNNFRLGCVDTIGERLRETTEQNRAGVIDEVDDGDVDAQPVREADPIVVSKALILINRDRKEVDVYYKDLSEREGLKSLSRSSFRTSHTGREAGREAGKRIHLGAQINSAGSNPRALGK